MNTSLSQERYNRQVILKGFGAAGQQKLAEAKVLVVGAGGLGCPALQYLAAAGVGTIGIVDDDTVSMSNLHRQVLYGDGDIGQLKAAIAAKKLQQLNSDITIHPHPVRLSTNNALGIINDYHAVIDATDNFASRYLINDACSLLGKPLVYGAVSQYQGQVALFGVKDNNGFATNYRHLFPQPPKEAEVSNCAEAGVLGVLPGIIGAMQAAEVIKMITGIGKPLINRMLTYDLLTNFFYELDIVANGSTNGPKTEAEFLLMNYNDACAAKPDGVQEIDAETFHALRKSPSSVVIDVREIGEVPALQNIPHQQIPMSVFEEEMARIDAQNVLLVCQHGIRSLHAGELLQERAGGEKNIYSLKGGIVKWRDVL